MSSLDKFVGPTAWPSFIRVEDSGWLLDPEIVDGLPVWEWSDKSGVYTHRVFLGHLYGQVHWQVWQDGRLLSDRPTLTIGVPGALNMINRWRRAGIDEQEIQRVRALEAAESDPDFYTCQTCPCCGCPGMG